MFGLRYSPFDKPFEDIQASDLVALKGVSEGWYVEYKENFPSPEKIGRSVSSFANTWGGWIFFGITDAPISDPESKKFPGIRIEEVDRLCQSISQSILGYVNPTPYFEIRQIRGPNPDIDLSEHRVIIVVKVPQGNDAPYVHRSGRIFRRVADQSDPKPEFDRAVLDNLWRRSEIIKDDFDKIVDRDFNFASREKNLSYAEIIFFSDPWKQTDNATVMRFDEFHSAMNREIDLLDVRFPNICTSPEGYIARNKLNSTPLKTPLSWEYCHAGRNNVIIPLNSCVFLGDGMDIFVRNKDNAREIFKVLAEFGANDSVIIDLSYFYALMISIITRYHIIRKINGDGNNSFCKIKLYNASRRIPFIDTDLYAKYIKENGIPYVHGGYFIIPEGRGPGSCIELSKEKLRCEDDQFIACSAMLLFFEVSRAFGLTLSAFGLDPEADEDSFVDAYTKLVKLGMRIASGSGNP